MANRKRSLFQRTEDAANAAQNAQSGGGNDGGILALRSLLGGARRQARSNSEALGMGFREFILPMIIQGAMDWKNEYNQRGKDKAKADELYESLKRGETLSADDQAFFDQMQKNRPERYPSLSQAPAQQPNPQGGQPAAPNQPSQIAQELANAANLPNPDWEAVGAPFSGVDYDAKWAQDSQQILNGLQGGAQEDYLSRLLKATRGGW